MHLCLEEQVGSRIDEKVRSNRAANSLNPANLRFQRVQTLAIEPLVFEVAPDDPRRLEEPDVCTSFLGVGRIGAFKVDCPRAVDRSDNAPGIIKSEFQRDLLRIT